MQRWAFLVASAASLSAGPAGAHAQPTAAAPGRALRVPGRVYTVRPDSLELRGILLRGVIPYRYTNPRRRAAAVWGCISPDPPRLERWDGRGWTVVYEPIVRRCGASPQFIAAGATRGDVFEFLAGPDSLRSRVGPLLPLSLLPGRFRLIREITDSTVTSSGPPLARLRPGAERTSNVFELRVAPSGAP